MVRRCRYGARVVYGANRSSDRHASDSQRWSWAHAHRVAHAPCDVQTNGGSHPDSHVYSEGAAIAQLDPNADTVSNIHSPDVTNAYSFPNPNAATHTDAYATAAHADANTRSLLHVGIRGLHPPAG